MSCQSAVYQWTKVVTTHMPHLSEPQAAVLALWSLGMVLARSCALTAVSLCLAKGLEHKPNTVRQQLREFCYEAKAKCGGPRQALSTYLQRRDAKASEAVSPLSFVRRLEGVMHF